MLVAGFVDGRLIFIKAKPYMTKAVFEHLNRIY